MLPGEQETRIELRSRYEQDFKLAADALTVAYRVHHRLCCDDHRRYSRLAKATCVGGLTKLCVQYRSIHALCELGLTYDAGILLRTMFEAFLYIEFLFCKSPPALGSPRAPAPNDRLTVNFRAKLYLLEDAIQRDKYVRMLIANPALRSYGDPHQAGFDRGLKEVYKAVGQDWVDWRLNRRNRTMFGLGVEEMARRLGWKDWYDAVYRAESRGVHGCDFDRFLANEGKGVCTPKLCPDTETTTLPIRLASDFLVAAAQLVNDRFRLGQGAVIRRLHGDLVKHWVPVRRQQQ